MQQVIYKKYFSFILLAIKNETEEREKRNILSYLYKKADLL